MLNWSWNRHDPLAASAEGDETKILEPTPPPIVEAPKKQSLPSLSAAVPRADGLISAYSGLSTRPASKSA